jgi:hypothetical protein
LITNFTSVLFRTSTRREARAGERAAPSPRFTPGAGTGLVGKSFQGLGPPAEGGDAARALAARRLAPCRRGNCGFFARVVGAVRGRPGEAAARGISRSRRLLRSGPRGPPR